jgi:hypothetical protein
MTFSFFAILMILIVALVGFIHSFQGFFSAAISAILAVFAAVIALSYHEIIVEKFLGGAMADSAHAMVLVVLFAVVYFVLRVIFDQAVPGNVRLPSGLDKAGAAIMGAIAGIFVAGVLAVAAQEMSLFPALLGYARYAVDDRPVRLPTVGRSQDMVVKDQMNDATFEDAESAGDQQKLLLPVDDIVVNMTSRLSSSGALSAGAPLSTIHPNWLQELFGQRLGMEPGAKRVLMGTPSAKTTDAKLDNLYLIGGPGPTDLACLDGEYSELRGSARPKIPQPNPADGRAYYVVKPSYYLIVARVRFDLGAGDKLGGGLVRISTGSVRLVAPGISPSTGEPVDSVDYYPIGTLQYKGPHVNVNNQQVPTTLIKPVLMLQNADDFLFVKKDDTNSDSSGTTGGNQDSGADFVFNVYKTALTKTASSQMQIIKRSEDEGHPFIEVKRLVREDINGHPLLSESELQKDKDSIAVIHRDKLLSDEMSQKKTADGKLNFATPFYNDPSAVADTSSTPTPPTPTPTATPTPTPTPAAPAATAAFPLDVADAPKVYDRFYTSVASDRDSGDLTINWPDGAKGTMSVDNNQIHALSIDGATTADMRGTTDKHFINLAAPLNMSLVQVTGKPKADPAVKAWSWKDQFNDLALQDASGAKIGPPIGAWVQYSDGGTKVTARFNSEGGVKVDDIKPAGEVKQVWFVFAVPKGTKIAKLVAGQTSVSDQPVEVP